MSHRPLITDHALVRYMERALGLPVEELREQLAAMLQARVEGPPPAEGAVSVGAHLFLLRQGRVATIVAERAFHRGRRRHARELAEDDPRDPACCPAQEGDPWWGDMVRQATGGEG